MYISRTRRGATQREAQRRDSTKARGEGDVGVTPTLIIIVIIILIITVSIVIIISTIQVKYTSNRCSRIVVCILLYNNEIVNNTNENIRIDDKPNINNAPPSERSSARAGPRSSPNGIV